MFKGIFWRVEHIRIVHLHDCRGKIGTAYRLRVAKGDYEVGWKRGIQPQSRAKHSLRCEIDAEQSTAANPIYERNI